MRDVINMTDYFSEDSGLIITGYLELFKRGVFMPSWRRMCLFFGSTSVQNMLNGRACFETAALIYHDLNRAR